jgi:hypothetical protein
MKHFTDKINKEFSEYLTSIREVLNDIKMTQSQDVKEMYTVGMMSLLIEMSQVVPRYLNEFAREAQQMFYDTKGLKAEDLQGVESVEKDLETPFGLMKLTTQYIKDSTIEPKEQETAQKVLNYFREGYMTPPEPQKESEESETAQEENTQESTEKDKKAE